MEKKSYINYVSSDVLVTEMEPEGVLCGCYGENESVGENDGIW